MYPARDTYSRPLYAELTTHQDTHTELDNFSARASEKAGSASEFDGGASPTTADTAYM